MRKKQKKTKQTIKETIFRFWNNGLEYFCIITSPVDIPKYKLKEIFDRTFVGLKEPRISILQSFTTFKEVNPDITYEIKPVKEKENV